MRTDFSLCANSPSLLLLILQSEEHYNIDLSCFLLLQQYCSDILLQILNNFILSYNMNLVQFEQQLFGVDVSDYRATKLTSALIQKYRSKIYDRKRAHFLIYALQFRLPLPSLASMAKSEARAKKRQQNQLMNPKIIANKICCPEEIVLKGARKSALETYFPDPMEEERIEGMSIPANIQRTGYNRRPVRKQRPVRNRRNRNSLPEVKAEIVQPDQPKPAYFIKKKANQKRRRLEKHMLIKTYKKELKRIYGDAIFTSQWRISRATLRKALGLPEQLPYSEGDLAAMKEMFDEGCSVAKSLAMDIFKRSGLALKVGELPQLRKNSKKTGKAISKAPRRKQSHLRGAARRGVHY